MSAPSAPCRHGDQDPEDWFITKAGTQYPFEPIELSDEEVDAIAATLPEDLDDAIARAVEVEKAARLLRRKKARRACGDCPIRTACLNGAIERREPHGTWGGAYEEELRKVYALAKRWTVD